ncbi:MAG TPA: hypothetical protein VI934_01795 [Candidatus Nanoarchaeia archaeon]|nr:hypothetical protein [Candidatus Nanoarchaeia archaeon]
MTSVAYPLRIPEGIMGIAKMLAKYEHVDNSTALRLMFHAGAEEYVLGLLEKGRITIGRAAELLKISIQDIHEIAQRHNVQLGATPEQQRESKKTLKTLLKKKL